MWNSGECFDGTREAMTLESMVASTKIEYGGFAASPGAPENQDDIDHITIQVSRVATRL